MTYGKIMTYLLLILLGLAFMGWYHLKPDAVTKIPTQHLERLPDAVAYGVFTKQFNEYGAITNTLQTEQLIHYPQDDTSYLTHPYVTTTNNQQKQPWTIQAEQGRLRHGTEIITLWGNVILHQSAGPNNTSNTILTEQLTYNTLQETAYTDQAVTFKQPEAIIKSVGMNAHLITEEITLLNHARGYFLEENGPIYVRADWAELDNRNGIGTYHGNIYLDQNNTHLTADTATTQVDDQQRLLRATAEGTPEKRAHYWTTDTDAVRAKADTIYYDAENQQITFVGNAELTQNQDTYQAPVIKYDVTQETIMSPQSESGRTEIIIYQE